MDEDFNELKQDIKEIKAEVKLISETLMRNTVSLEIHEKRTALAEKRLDNHDAYKRWEVGLFVSAVIALLMKLLVK